MASAPALAFPSAPPLPASVALCCKGSIIAHEVGTSRLLVIPATCKSWLCPTCAPVKSRKLAEQLRQGKPHLSMTLTLRHFPWNEPRREAKKLKKAFAQLVVSIRRTFGWFEYAAVCELTSAQEPHYHIMARGPYIPKAWLKQRWFELTGAYQVDIHRIAAPDRTASHNVKMLTEPPHHQTYSPERLASKGVQNSAAALHPLRVVQMSKRYLRPPGHKEAEQPKPTLATIFSKLDAHTVADLLAHQLVAIVRWHEATRCYELSSAIGAEALMKTPLRLGDYVTTFQLSQGLTLSQGPPEEPLAGETTHARPPSDLF